MPLAKLPRPVRQLYRIYQTQDGGADTLVATTFDLEWGNEEVEKINANLASHKIPSWVSKAYIVPVDSAVNKPQG